MKYAYLILITLSTTCLFGQAPGYDVKPNPVYTYFISDKTDHVGEGTLKNNSKTNIELFWTRENAELPPNWHSAVCDCNQCYADFLDKCPDNKPNIMGPNDSCALLVHMMEDSTEGVAHVIVWLYERQDSSTKYRADYYFNKRVSNKEVKNIEIMVYPNPVLNSFRVESNQKINRLELYSVLGENVIAFNASTQGNYDISPLKEGLYFVKLIGANNQNLKTIRIQKILN